MAHIVSQLTRNIISVLFVWAPGFGTRKIFASPLQIALALLAALFGQFVAVTTALGGPNAETLLIAGGLILTSLLVALLIARLLKASDRLTELATGLLWALAFGGVLSGLILQMTPTSNLAAFLTTGVFPGLVLGSLFLIFRLGPLPGLVTGLAFAMMFSMLAALWIAPGATGGRGYAKALPNAETVLAQQSQLMAQQTNQLRPGDPERVELFALLGAGFPYEKVFRREVDAVTKLLETRFNADRRVLRLVNDFGDASAYPLLNLSNLETGLAALASAMDPDDLALIFLTSHGEPGHLATTFLGAIPTDLTPGKVNAALTKADIQNAIIIVSACFSGSFVAALDSPNRLILTAAAADRTSFGCANENDWTNWGRAFFDTALRETADPRDAARRAQEIVSELELELGLTASLPQIIEGTKIGPVIDNWLIGLDRP